MSRADDVQERLAAALAAEYAAIYAYGTIGVRLAAAERTAARAAEAAHRDRRDALILRLAGSTAPATPAPAGYALPFPVTDRESALKLAVQVEDRIAAAWRAVLPATAVPPAATTPATTTPAGAKPADPAIPDPAIPDPAIPDPAIPDPAIPDPAIPDPAIPDPATADRATAMKALTDAAVQATRWRRLAGVNPITVVFPGRE